MLLHMRYTWLECRYSGHSQRLPGVILSHGAGANENSVVNRTQTVRHRAAFRPAKKHLFKKICKATSTATKEANVSYKLKYMQRFQFAAASTIECKTGSSRSNVQLVGATNGVAEHRMGPTSKLRTVGVGQDSSQGRKCDNQGARFTIIGSSPKFNYDNCDSPEEQPRAPKQGTCCVRWNFTRGRTVDMDTIDN